MLPILQAMITVEWGPEMRNWNEELEWGLGNGNGEWDWGTGTGNGYFTLDQWMEHLKESYVHMQHWRGLRQLRSCFVDCMKYILNSWPWLLTLWAPLVDVGGLCYSPGGGSPLGLGSQAGLYLYQEEEQHRRSPWLGGGGGERGRGLVAQSNSSTTAYKGTDCAYI